MFLAGEYVRAGAHKCKRRKSQVPLTPIAKSKTTSDLKWLSINELPGGPMKEQA
jgi:hypothetical protein